MARNGCYQNDIDDCGSHLCFFSDRDVCASYTCLMCLARVSKVTCADWTSEATNERDSRGYLPIHLALQKRAGFTSIRELLAANPRTVNALDGDAKRDKPRIRKPKRA
eukprot:692200-Amphidinium_carterae.1